MKGGLSLNEMGKVLLSTPTQREWETRDTRRKIGKEDTAERVADRMIFA